MFACDVPRGPTPAPPDDEVRIEKASEIVARGRRRHIGLSRVRGAIDTLEEALLERDDEPAGPVAPLHQPLQKGPAHPGLGDLPQPAVGLLDMGLDAEPDPGRGVTLGPVGAALNLLEGRIVSAGMTTEVLLDRDELRCEQTLAGKHE